MITLEEQVEERAMNLLCTIPGRHGDILWSLPTVRALAEATGEPVSVALSAKYGSLQALIAEQGYTKDVVVLADWQIEETAPMTPRVPPAVPERYDRVVHLGYEGWPSLPLPCEQHRLACTQTAVGPLDLDRPWIATPSVQCARAATPRVWLGWSEEHFELKVGLTSLLACRFPDVEFWWLRPWGGRYDAIDRTRQIEAEAAQHVLGPNVTMLRADWRLTAALAQTCWCYLGCLSAPWVLANALGLPTVIVEPNSQRHHPVFWVERGGQNRLVRGGDGLPTFDARHAGDVLEQRLLEVPCD